jgi:predicted ArsR family transcriptional regulator
MMATTAAAYATQQGISISTARKRLTEMVEAGLATVSYNVIIGQGSRKRGARSHMVSIRGNLYNISQ